MVLESSCCSTAQREGAVAGQRLGICGGQQSERPGLWLEVVERRAAGQQGAQVMPQYCALAHGVDT